MRQSVLNAIVMILTLALTIALWAVSSRYAESGPQIEWPMPRDERAGERAPMDDPQTTAGAVSQSVGQSHQQMEDTLSDVRSDLLDSARPVDRPEPGGVTTATFE